MTTSVKGACALPRASVPFQHLACYPANVTLFHPPYFWTFCCFQFLVFIWLHIRNVSLQTVAVGGVLFTTLTIVLTSISPCIYRTKRVPDHVLVYGSGSKSLSKDSFARCRSKYHHNRTTGIVKWRRSWLLYSLSSQSSILVPQCVSKVHAHNVFTEHVQVILLC